jgi:hypothetical protein
LPPGLPSASASDYGQALGQQMGEFREKGWLVNLLRILKRRNSEKLHLLENCE